MSPQAAANLERSHEVPAAPEEPDVIAEDPDGFVATRDGRDDRVTSGPCRYVYSVYAPPDASREQVEQLRDKVEACIAYALRDL